MTEQEKSDALWAEVCACQKRIEALEVMVEQQGRQIARLHIEKAAKQPPRSSDAAEGFWQPRLSDVEADLAKARARIAELEAALVWYREQARGCRKLGRSGDQYRAALDADGGEIARRALEAKP